MELARAVDSKGREGTGAKVVHVNVQRHQQAVLRDIFIAGFGSALLGSIEHPYQVRRDIRLPGPAALYFRDARDRRIHRELGRCRIAAGSTDQPARGPFIIIEKGFQQMFGNAVLMAACQGFHLRGLQDAARPFGEIREVQGGTSSMVPPSRRRG